MILLALAILLFLALVGLALGLAMARIGKGTTEREAFDYSLEASLPPAETTFDDHTMKIGE